MRISPRRYLPVGLLLVAILGGGGATLWFGLTHRPDFYQQLVAEARESRPTGTSTFVSHTSQLRNDIVNEDRWVAVFTAAEINSWLANELVTQFSDRIPAGVSDPRVVFEPDRVTLAFTRSESGVPVVVWAVAEVTVTGPNQVEFRFEKLRAGAVPIPADQVRQRLLKSATGFGLAWSWDTDNGACVLRARLDQEADSASFVLESVEVADGWIRLAGRSNHPRATAHATAPDRQPAPVRE